MEGRETACGRGDSAPQNFNHLPCLPLKQHDKGMDAVLRLTALLFKRGNKTALFNIFSIRARPEKYIASVTKNIRANTPV
jgi:hypothetical protein